MPCANVFPTCFQFVVAINPFKNFAILVPMLFAVLCILSQGILFIASFNFCPIVEPTSYQFPFFIESNKLFVGFNFDKSPILGELFPLPLLPLSPTLFISL